ncbi:MAG: glycosyltransferase family 2 protein [Patescibacteria group bacterium]
MISVIILSYRNPALLRLCLKSLVAALPKDFNYEIVVVDNATRSETRNVVCDEFKEAFRSIKFVPIKKNSGYTRGINEGISAAQGEYFLALNQDIVVLKGAVEKLLLYFKDHLEIGLIGPELLNFNGTHQDSYFRFYTPVTIFYRRIGYLPFARRILDPFLLRETDPSKVQKPDWVSGAAFMTSREAIKKVGLLDEKLFHYFSDVDWARRFWENGYQVVYYPEAKFYHYLGRSSKGKLLIFDIFFNQTTRWHIKDFWRYFRKYGFLTRHSARNISQPSHATTY